MIAAAGAEHRVLFKDPFSYCAHPHAVRASNGDLLAVFNRAPRRPYILHPPEDPEFRNVLMRSCDNAETWSPPEAVPGYDWHGTECAGLTVLRNGRVLLNQWRFRWLPLGLALASGDGLTFPDQFLARWRASPEHDVPAGRHVPAEQLAPWARGPGETWMHQSDDHGRCFIRSARIGTAHFSGGYGIRGACELADGDILLPLTDVPNYRSVFTVRSRDGGLNWAAPAKVAEEPGSEFEEPALIETSPGNLLLVLRDNGTRWLHAVASADGGATWTAPRRLPIAGYPAHLLVLQDSRLLLTYGWRQPGYGIRAVVSHDGGQIWDTDATMQIRGDLPNKNLGYPCTVDLGDGRLLTVYYGEDTDGVTCIMGTWWRL